MGKRQDTFTRHRIFCSYSSADRSRVTGLGLLLEALGHRVFLDHKTIRPGQKWEASLQAGLDEADILCVYWTRSASKSNWVRNEIEYFHAQYQSRPIIPIIGDETPLSQLLSAYQASDLFPLINELLELKKTLTAQKIASSEIEQALLDRLKEAGIEFSETNQKKLMRLFAPVGILGFLAAPLDFLSSIGNRAVEATAQTSINQGTALGSAVLVGATTCAFFGHSENSIPNNPLASRPTIYSPQTTRLVYASQVHSYDIGQEIREEYSNPTFTLGYNDLYSFELGCGGSIILGFNDEAFTGLENIVDLRVAEYAGPELPYPDFRPATVEVSMNGMNWVPLGQVAPGTVRYEFGQRTNESRPFRLVRISDRETGCADSGLRGARIDAVAVNLEQ